MGSGGRANEAAAPDRGGLADRRLRRLFHLLGVRQLMKIGNGAFGMGGGLHDGARVVLQHLDPARDVAGMIGARLDAKPKVGGKESGAHFGDIS